MLDSLLAPIATWIVGVISSAGYAAVTGLVAVEKLLGGLKAAGVPLERVVLCQGGKVCRVHLGPVQAPFYEERVAALDDAGPGLLVRLTFPRRVVRHGS